VKDYKETNIYPEVNEITVKSRNGYSITNPVLENDILWFDVIESDPKDGWKQRIDNIMMDFDFVKVQKVMSFLNWNWSIHNRPPTIEEMKMRVRKLFLDLINKFPGFEVGYIATGGFKVEKGDNYLKLEFLLEESEIELE
jgi:hypothetical protein